MDACPNPVVDPLRDRGGGAAADFQCSFLIIKFSPCISIFACNWILDFRYLNLSFVNLA